ncbi:hypothetical protein [Thermoplasma volcanium GSS1]|uniref:Methyltransferase type 11 domain-containing protein n=1 Tax=Thermoplasma volcanium (strain ATCC 51530 / DSM 4299 / JCM 9571 / NBRC 15438 / GSS1) TaxID=273116 RepID=Q97B31_THEVO|nr:class I SAM-dependent methyltransferase [Thermoplasma volcanium]BAB59770.1 hypothetical protein [Thermoplasma volcanium GSS1]
MQTEDNEDAFGHALLDFSSGHCSYEMIETSDGKIDVTSISYYFKNYDQWPLMEQKAIEYAKGIIVDAGAGAGRHSLYLRKKGYQVFPFDISPGAVSVMKKRGLDNASIMSLEEFDMSFDTLLLLGNNFGLLRSYKKAPIYLRKLYEKSSDHAMIIGETTDPVSTRFASNDSGLEAGDLTIRVVYKEYKTPWFEYMLASKEKLEMLVKDTGWRVKKFIEMDGVDVYCFLLEKEK